MTSGSRYLNRLVLASFALAAALLIATPDWKSKAIAAGPPPEVLSTSPAANAVNVPTNATISITFNEAMNPTTLSSNIFVFQGFLGITGSVSFNNATNVATFTPSSALQPGRTYSVWLGGGALDLDGNPAPFRFWSFTTGSGVSNPVAPSTAPQVTSTTPAASATNVASNIVVSAVFNEAMYVSTLNYINFKLSGPNGMVPGNVAFNTTTLTATYQPSNPLAASTTYTATLTREVKDAGGTPLAAEKTWSFTTAAVAAPPASPRPTTTPPPTTNLTTSGPLVIDRQNNVTIENVRITSGSTHCIVISNSSNITIRNSDIGACRGNGIGIMSSSNITIVDNYIHPERAGNGCNPCDIGDGVIATRSSNVLIQGNVIAYGESNIELLGTRDSQVIGNFLLNPLGPSPRGMQVQAWAFDGVRSSNIRIEGNYTVASRDPKYAFQERQTEAINLGYTDGAVVTGNYVTGGQYVSGCGILADFSANSMQFLNNTVVETGECGIGIASGTNQVVEGNRIYTHGLDLPNAGNTALYVWRQGSAGCGPVRIANNTAVLIRPNGSFSSYWKGSGCDIATVTGNVWDQAAINALTPLDSKMTAPASIPPRPYQTKVVSPFTK